MFASFVSPAHSTLLRALRKGYMSTLSRFTSALFSKHKPIPSLRRPWVTSIVVARALTYSTSPAPVIVLPPPTPVVVPLTPAPAAISQPVLNGPSPYDEYMDIFTEFDDKILALN